MKTNERKECPRCKIMKCFEDFHKSKNRRGGLDTYCKICKKENSQERYLRNKERILEQSAEWSRKNLHKRRLYSKRYAEKNREELRLKQRRWSIENPEYYKEYRIQNKYKINAKCSGRRRIVKRATPVWADKQKIEEIYKKAQILEQETGVKYHVDHIVPLVNKVVCGLHVHNNLRVIRAVDNLRKHNKFVQKEEQYELDDEK